MSVRRVEYFCKRCGIKYFIAESDDPKSDLRPSDKYCRECRLQVESGKEK